MKFVVSVGADSRFVMLGHGGFILLRLLQWCWIVDCSILNETKLCTVTTGGLLCFAVCGIIVVAL
jgi:hypothetical protein